MFATPLPSTELITSISEHNIMQCSQSDRNRDIYSEKMSFVSSPLDTGLAKMTSLSLNMRTTKKYTSGIVVITTGRGEVMNRKEILHDIALSHSRVCFHRNIFLL